MQCEETAARSVIPSRQTMAQTWVDIFDEINPSGEDCPFGRRPWKRCGADGPEARRVSSEGMCGGQDPCPWALIGQVLLMDILRGQDRPSGHEHGRPIRRYTI